MQEIDIQGFNILNETLKRMKKLLILALATSAMLLISCDKFGYSAQYKYDVSDEYGTRAILNGHDETGPDITWEEGDIIEFEVQVFKEEYLTLAKEEGKLVYENGSWVTYKVYGSSFSKVDCISVHASTLDCSVRMRFSCQNGDLRHPDSNSFVCTWVRTIPFAEGLQTVLVKLPFEN